MKKIVSNIIVYGLGHAIVDASCAALVYGALWSGNRNLVNFSFFAILFNILAFAMQAPIGLLLDKVKSPVRAALLGCVLTALSLLFANTPLLAVILAGLGNALFHLGGGIISLNLKSGKASLPGLFVAPGALGLFVGIFMAKKGVFMPAPFIALLALIFILILLLKPPHIDYNTDSKNPIKYLKVIILLLLFSVAIRSLVGAVLNYPWKSNLYLLIIFTFAVFLGKALGGIFSDRFGWTRISVSGLLISAPLLAFGEKYAFMAILGILLFNMTMPVTLTAISNLLPGRAGFAFGLTPLALIAGLLIENTRLSLILYNKYTILSIVLISSLVLFIALKLYFKSQNNGMPQKTNDNSINL